MKVTLGDFALDSDTRQLLRGGEEVHLSPKAFELLCTLIEARPKALSKDRLQTMLWPSTFVTEGNLSVLVTEIRHALEDDVRAPRFIRTVQRFGYAFLGEAGDASVASAFGTAGSGHWLVWGRQTLELPEGEVIVGRDPHSQVHLDVHGVSRRHARLRVSANQVTIEDLGSKNGTLKHDEPIAGVVLLQDNDRLQFGPLAVVYRYRPGLACPEGVMVTRKRKSGNSLEVSQPSPPPVWHSKVRQTCRSSDASARAPPHHQAEASITVWRATRGVMARRRCGRGGREARCRRATGVRAGRS